MTANEIPIGIWISFALTIVALALSQLLFSRLEKHHRITFEQLGSPHLFANNTPYNNMLFQRWLFSAKALQLDDTVSSMVWAILDVLVDPTPATTRLDIVKAQPVR